MAQAHPKQGQGAKEDQLEEPQVVLWPRDKVTLGWRKTFPPGAGMVNLGNTCYLNSSLQALFHIPALANWLLEELQSHTQRCEANSTNASFCSVCAMMRTLRNTLDRSTPVIKPALIQHKLKCIGKTLMYGRQEDAHEFIKLLLDHMEKSYLSFRHATKLDHRSKETTPLNQIFGGYLRQQVICPLCRYVSTTFSHFQDLVLDIRSVNSVDDALNLHFRKETLDSENAYRCERCHRKVPATKRHLIERAPHVLLIQLKRFTMSGGKIGKHINIQRMIDISRFVSGGGGGGKQGGGGGGGPYQYRLTSMVIHLGGSLHGGHYTAVAEASNGSMFEFDDSSVRSISLQSALLRNPYILFYEMVRRPKDHQQGGIKQVVRQSSEKALIRQNSDGITASSKTLPTSHSASSVTNGYHHNAHHVDSGGGGGGKGNLPPPLPCHKERERLSFALKSTQSRAMLIDPPNSRPSKIILNNSSTSLLGTKNSSPSSSASSSNSSSTPSKSSTFSNSVKSSTSSSSSSPSSSVARSSVLSSSSSSASPASKMSISSSSKLGLSSSSTKSSLPSSSASMASSTSKSAVQSASSKSSSSTPSLVPYLDDSEDSEVDEGRRGARDKVRANGVKERVSGTAQRVTNGEAGDSDGSAKARGMVPRSLQVVQAGAGKGKVDTGWQVTDAALHSPSESSGGSGSGGRAFTVVEQPVGTSRPDPDPDTQGWTVTKVGEGQTRPQQPPARRPRPELEKSLSHDCVLPSQRGSSGPRSEGDSASLRSKASVDSGRSDRSTKSMKRSLFSLFTCVSSARSPDSPPSPRRSSDAGLPDSASATSTSTAAQDAATARVQDSTASTPDKAKRSREQEDQETEPSSPSKKACQGKVMKDGSKDTPKGSTKDGSREGQSGFPTTTTSTTSTNTTSTTTATSTTTSAPKNGTANSTAQHERKAKNWQQQQQQQGSDVPKNDAGTKNGTSTHQRHPNQQNGTTKSTSSTSTSSLSSSSPSSDSEEEEEEEEGGGKWVEKTKEVMGSARLHPSPSVVEWNGAGQRREKERRDGLWDGTRSSAVVDELRRAGNSAYGAEVNAWGGGRSMLDQEAERARREAKKRSADDLYNEEMDSGRMKKMKGQKKGGWGGGSQGPPHSPWNNNNNNNNISNSNSNSNGNPFQRLQDARNNGNWNNNNNSSSSNSHHNNHNHHRYNNNNPSYYNNNHHYYHNGNNSNANYHHANNPRHHNQYNRGWRRGGGRPKFHHQRKYGGKEKYPKHTW